MSNSKLGEQFFKDTAHADVVFVVENEEIPGHRAAFAIACSYFDKLLYGDFIESKTNRVEITGKSAEVFKQIKRFIYLGQLEAKDWKIVDLLGLLSVAHEYQYQELFSEVLKVLEKQPIDIDSWTLVNSAASIYDLDSLKAKCIAFAETEVDNFLRFKDMEKMTEEFICTMFDSPQIQTFNQDQLFSSLLQWKKTHSSAKIMSLFQKICWNEVSHNIIAIIAKLFFLNLQTEDEVPFFNEMFDEIQLQSPCIAKVENLLLSKSKPVNFSMEKHDCFLYCLNGSHYLQLNFKKNHADFEIPVKTVEFELSNNYQIRQVVGWSTRFGNKRMDYKMLTGSNNWLKHNATYSEAEPLYSIGIFLENGAEAFEFILRSLVIY